MLFDDHVDLFDYLAIHSDNSLLIKKVHLIFGFFS